MGRREGKKERVWEVRILFEPNRLAKEYLADAYEHVVPVIRRSVKRGGAEKQEVRRPKRRVAGGEGA